MLDAIRSRIGPSLPCPDALADRVKAAKGLRLDSMSDATREAYTAAIEAALAEVELAPEPEAPAPDAPSPTGETPRERVLRQEVERLKAELAQARAEPVKPAPTRVREVPKPGDPRLTPFGGGSLTSWARGGES